MFGQIKAKNATEYINSLKEPRKSEIKRIHAFIRKTIPKLKPGIVYDMLAYGKYHYKYPSGREGDWSVVGLASNKAYISLYVSAVNEKGYLAEQYKKKLPKANIGKSCIRFKKLDDLDQKVLKDLLKQGEKLGGMYKEK